MHLPAVVDYPLVAIGDLHGRRDWLAALVGRLRALPEWPDCRLVFLGDLVDRGPDVRGTLDLVIQLLRERPGSTVVSGNHDYGLLRAARLDGGPPSDYWTPHYGRNYDHESTFRSYLGREPNYTDFADWQKDLDELCEAMPKEHRELLAAMPWVAEAPGHVFLHNGLSPDLAESAEEQMAALRAQIWGDALHPIPGTRTAELWQTHYPVWLGADKRLSKDPLPLPGRVQVTGHMPVERPDVNGVRIRIDTAAGRREPLTGCLLRSATAEPVFVFSNGGGPT
jgi:Calcineurin-like phosphoesterase